MEKKTILLEISSELIDKIDQLNTMGNRSEFISFLLHEQINKTIEDESDSTFPPKSKINED